MCGEKDSKRLRTEKVRLWRRFQGNCNPTSQLQRISLNVGK